MADKQNAFDDSDVSWREPTAPPPEAPKSERPKIRTRWLTLWIVWCIGRPAVSVILTFIFSLGTLPPLSLLTGMWIVLQIAFFTVGAGLLMRELWAWRVNWGLIFGEPIYLVSLHLVRHQTFAANLGEYFVAIVAILVFYALWSWPNYIYFKKRKHLFH
jgi:hypothetical protein